MRVQARTVLKQHKRISSVKPSLEMYIMSKLDVILSLEKQSTKLHACHHNKCEKHLSKGKKKT